MPRSSEEHRQKEAVRAINNIQNDTTVLYQPLDSHHEETRLVTVNPGNFEDDIYCSLSKVSLEDGLSYEALSYVWGSLSSTRQIYLNGLSYQVTKNLESALRHLRNVDRPRVLWIDALCINQSDIPERNSQVMHMSSIYKKAREVIAWLGEEAEDSNLAFDAFDVLPRDAEIHWNPEINPELKEVLVDSKYARAISKLAYRPWWDRIWTVQESILGQALQFVCGQRQVSIQILASVVQNYYQHLRGCCYEGKEDLLHLLALDYFMEPLNRLQIDRELGTFHDFQFLVSTYRSRHCTDPRDKIYGLLGLASEKIASLIQPDYSVPAALVYEQTTVRIIETSQNFNVFSQFCPQYMKPVGIRTIKLPSWVPDWTCEGSYDRFLDLRVRLERTDDYMASAETLASVRSIETGKIAANGIIFGSFTILSEYSKYEIGNNLELFETWEELARTMKQPGQAHDDVEYCTTYYDAFWQTLCCSIAPSRSNLLGGIERTSNNSFYRSWFEAWWNHSKSSSVGTEFTAAEIEVFSACVQVSTQMRKMFVSDKGWLGLAPMDAEIGDRIALLQGGKVPYIVRPKAGNRNEFELIGDAYVHGIMDGEAWRLDKVKEIILV